MPKKRVLISGASIAGPTLAYWLDRYGFEVTIVEKAETVRGAYVWAGELATHDNYANAFAAY